MNKKPHPQSDCVFISYAGRAKQVHAAMIVTRQSPRTYGFYGCRPLQFGQRVAGRGLGVGTDGDLKEKPTVECWQHLDAKNLRFETRQNFA